MHSLVRSRPLGSPPSESESSFWIFLSVSSAWTPFPPSCSTPESLSPHLFFYLVSHRLILWTPVCSRSATKWPYSSFRGFLNSPPAVSFFLSVSLFAASITLSPQSLCLFWCTFSFTCSSVLFSALHHHFLKTVTVFSSFLFPCSHKGCGKQQSALILPASANSKKKKKVHRVKLHEWEVEITVTCGDPLLRWSEISAVCDYILAITTVFVWLTEWGFFCACVCAHVSFHQWLTAVVQCPDSWVRPKTHHHSYWVDPLLNLSSSFLSVVVFL